MTAALGLSIQLIMSPTGPKKPFSSLTTLAGILGVQAGLTPDRTGSPETGSPLPLLTAANNSALDGCGGRLGAAGRLGIGKREATIDQSRNSGMLG